MNTPIGITKALAIWAAETPVITSELAIHRASEVIYDIMGCTIAGCEDAGVRTLKEVALQQESGRATVFGAQKKLSAPWAALVNGMSAHALDYDDNFLPGLTHASAVLFPALLALGEEEHASGKDLIDALIIGLEVQSVVGRGVNRNHNNAGWHSTSTVGVIGAAAACGRLLKLSSAQMVNAMSLAVSMASGPKIQFGTMAKPFHAGMAAKNGILAARFAQAGMEGSDCALEGAMGFRDLYAGNNAQGWEPLIAHIGQPLAIEEFGFSLKLYPCCGSSHKVVDNVIALKEQYAFNAQDVEKVETLVEYVNQQNLMYSAPISEMEARFSMNYCVAVALMAGQLQLSDFTQSAIERPEIRALFPLVSMEAYPQHACDKDPTKRLPHSVKITLKNGDVYERASQWAKGTIHNPMSERELAEKFKHCCQHVLPEETMVALQQMLANVMNIEDIRDMSLHLDVMHTHR
ncbi:MmgE/PrpD family protein [Photobacterium damselae subsp. damselae]|uniref:MmgE/PrpD family protein n=1 Tax=Photobacterium damselae subsp. damselae TaxID=85581 RepID=A0A850QLT0_PHODD|nr:MmgE/PrpD family protein [Photobacterium damselae subsp. damselae]